MPSAPRQIISLPLFKASRVSPSIGGDVQSPQINHASAGQRLARFELLEQQAEIVRLPFVHRPLTRTRLRKCMMPENQVAMVTLGFQLAGQCLAHTFCISEDQPACRGTSFLGRDRSSGAGPPGHRDKTCRRSWRKAIGVYQAAEGVPSMPPVSATGRSAWS